MFIKIKKKAYAFLESLIIFMFVLVMANLSIKVISKNYLKSQNFSTYEDLKSLEAEEEKILEIINIKSQGESINKESLVEAVKKEKNMKYPELKNIEFTYENSEYFIKRKKSNSTMYIELIEKKFEDKNIFMPTHYKTKYIIN